MFYVKNTSIIDIEVLFNCHTVSVAYSQNGIVEYIIIFHITTKKELSFS